MAEHRWSGWPGAFCLDCGAEDMREVALAEGWLQFDGADGSDPSTWNVVWDTKEHEDEVTLSMECGYGAGV